MNNLSRDQQIQIIACLTEGQSIRATERITGIHRDTIMRLGERVGRGCAELHDRMMVGVRAGRLELDEIWGYVGKKQKRVQRHEISHKGDQYTFIGMSASAKAIISYRTGKRDSENTDLFIQDLRERVIGAPEISTDGFHPYKNAIRDAFNGRASHAVSREVESGTPSYISTSYVERQNLTLRMTQKRFARLTNSQRSSPITPLRSACTSPITTSAASMRLCGLHRALLWVLLIGCGRLAICWTQRWRLSRIGRCALRATSP
jgi:IS1 family transposase